MATAAATRLSGPVLSIPNYGSASPNRVKVKLATARSPAKSFSVSSPPASSAASQTRRSCTCSPTNHPGSFRCSLHKEQKPAAGVHGHGNGQSHSKHASPPSPPPPAVFSTGAGPGEGSQKLARRAIARSPQSQLRRSFIAAGGQFRPRPSRLSAVSFNGDNRQ